MNYQPENGGPACPLSVHPEHGYGPAASVQDGMSLRDYFAGQALVGLRASGIPDERRETYAAVADAAYRSADAMIAERNRKENKQ